jgi:hypothetical protein
VALPANSKVTIEDVPNAVLAVSEESKGQYLAKLPEGYARDRLLHSQAKLRVEVETEVILTSLFRLEHYAGYKALKFRLQAGASENFEELHYPQKLEHLKAGPQSKLDLRLVFNVSASPSNAYVVLQHGQRPSVQTVVHFDLLKGQAWVNFTHPELFQHLNGDYNLTLFAEFPTAAVPVLRWLISSRSRRDLGILKVELLGGTQELAELPSQAGSRQDKEIRHVFAPELVYAPPFVAVPVGGLLCVLFVGYLIDTLALQVKLNNFPTSISGQIHACLFVVIFSDATVADRPDRAALALHVLLVLHATAPAAAHPRCLR